MACLSQMELPGNSSRNQIFFDTVRFHDSESVSTVFSCLHNQFGCERAEAPLPVKKQTQAFWPSASSPGCQTTITAVPLSPSEASKISVCSKWMVKQWLAQPSGNPDSSFNFDLMHYSPAPFSLSYVMLLLKMCLSTFQNRRVGFMYIWHYSVAPI